MEKDVEFIKERYELCVERIREIVKAQEVPEKYRDYFKKEAEFILATAELSELVAKGKYQKLSEKELEQWNVRLYEKIAPENYEKSYANPAYAVKCFDMREGRLFSALSAKLMELTPCAMKQKTYFQAILMELFLEICSLHMEHLLKWVEKRRNYSLLWSISYNQEMYFIWPTSSNLFVWNVLVKVERFLHLQ